MTPNGWLVFAACDAPGGGSFVLADDHSLAEDVNDLTRTALVLAQMNGANVVWSRNLGTACPIGFEGALVPYGGGVIAAYVAPTSKGICPHGTNGDAMSANAFPTFGVVLSRFDAAGKLQRSVRPYDHGGTPTVAVDEEGAIALHLAWVDDSDVSQSELRAFDAAGKLRWTLATASAEQAVFVSATKQAIWLADGARPKGAPRLRRYASATGKELGAVPLDGESLAAMEGDGAGGVRVATKLQGPKVRALHVDASGKIVATRDWSIEGLAYGAEANVDLARAVGP